MENLFKLMPLFFQTSFRVKEESESHGKKLSCMLLSGDMSQPSYCLLMYLSSEEGKRRRKKKPLLSGIYPITIVCKKQELDKITSWEECQSAATPLSAFPYCNESLRKSSLFTFFFS